MRIFRISLHSMKKSFLTSCAVILFCISSVFSQGTWVRKADLPGSLALYTSCFGIGTKGYVLTGRDETSGSSSLGCKVFWSYDSGSNAWTQMADFAGPARTDAASFSIGNKGYIGTGWNLPVNAYFNDLWEYDAGANSWVQKADLPGLERHDAVGFSIGNKGYIGTGIDSNFISKNDLWEYDPVADHWTQKANLGSAGRNMAVGFNVGNKGYIGLGFDLYQNFYPKDFWEFDPALNTWTQKADFDTCRTEAIGLGIGNKGYIGTGRIFPFSTQSDDFREFDPVQNTWTTVNDLNLPRIGGIAFTLGNKGYIGLGWDGNFALYHDLWEYTPAGTSGIQSTTLSKNLLQVYPNPTNGTFTVKLNSPVNASATLRVLDVQGKCVYEKSLKTGNSQQPESIQLDNRLGDGNYFLQINSGDKQFTQTITLKRD